MAQVKGQLLTLPTQKSEIDNRWTSQKFGMIGASGIGKSKFWSFAKALYIQTEAGLNHLSVYKMPCRSWSEYQKIESLLIQASNGGDFPYDTIIIDTIDRFVDIINEEVLMLGKQKFPGIAEKINTIGDMPNGAGWSMATGLLNNVLSKLESLPCAVVFIGHLETKEVKEATRSIHKQTISIGGKTGGKLVAWCDHFLNISASYSGDSVMRTVRTRPTTTIEAKSREGVVPDGTKWGANDKENFDKFRKLFI